MRDTCPARTTRSRWWIGLGLSCLLFVSCDAGQTSLALWDLALARTGIRPEPTAQDLARDCPALTFTLYRMYRMERNRSQEIMVAVHLQSATTAAPGPRIYRLLGRTQHFTEGYTSVENLCELANTPGVTQVHVTSPGYPA